uniref:Uncharacterized protein n=1 Tax=Oryzias sinensis TaxID=183150 RepID=A0A8C7XWX6_9TELE
MVVKKKAAKVEAAVLDEEKLNRLIASLCISGGDEEAGQVAQSLQSFLQLTDPVQQVQLIKKTGSQLEVLTEEHSDGILDACLHTLSVVYTTLQAKNPLRRAIASVLGSVPGWLQERANDSLCGCLSDCMNRSSSDRYPQIVDIIATCLDGFPLGKIFFSISLLIFLHKVLEDHPRQNRYRNSFSDCIHTGHDSPVRGIKS